MNQLEKVVEDCSNALRLDPSYIKALNRRATAREQLGGTENLYLSLCGEQRIDSKPSTPSKTDCFSGFAVHRFHRCSDH